VHKTSKYTGIISFVIFTILPMVCTSFLTYYLYQNQHILENLNPLHWVLFSLLLTVASAVAIIPPTFLAIVLGFFLGWMAFPYLIFINMGAIVLIYGLYKVLDFSWVEQNVLNSPKVKDILERIQQSELKIIFFTKLSPLFPFAVTNLIFAVSGAKFKNILIGGFLGMIPRTLLAVHVGSQAKELQQLIENPNEGSLSKIIISLLILVSALGMYLVFKKSVSK
jgi:uncharacterized membrane protein YdjX (TVP38/TMEM64 family)